MVGSCIHANMLIKTPILYSECRKTSKIQNGLKYMDSGQDN